MIRIFHVYFPGRTLLLAASEGLVSALALLTAIFVWFGRDMDLALRYDHGLSRILFASFVCVLSMYYHDLYDSLVLPNFREVAARMVQVLGTVCVLLSVIYYGFPPVQIGRGPMLIWVFLAGASLIVWRRSYVALSASAAGSRSLLVGDCDFAGDLASEIRSRPEFGFRLIGCLSDRAVAMNVRRLGGPDRLAEVVERENVTRVITGNSQGGSRLPVQELLRLKNRGVQVYDAAEIYEALTGKLPVKWLQDDRASLGNGFRIPAWVWLYKRLASVVLSCIGLLLAWPLMLLTAIAIRLDSAGPVIFRQQRVGRNGRPFTLYKFRSMYDRSDPDLPAQPGDPRITRVGRHIRRLRIDEFPQLFNILRGDMCFVGPRPFTPAAESVCARQIRCYTERWSVTPGATGWAQVKYGYCATLEDNLEKLGHDLFYIKNISIGLDCLILLHTGKIMLLGRGAR
jgi:exopolysaccharide biosynthesis polyprenyl glycosylphosphotransferase